MIERIEHSIAYRPSIPALPDLIIVENEPLESLLLDRNLLGQPFREACLRSSELFLAHLADELLEHVGHIAELSILSKSLCYELPRAFSNVFSENLEVNLIATQRKKVTGNRPEIEGRYWRFDSTATTLLVGDTVATGATLCHALNRYLQHHPLKKVYVLSFAGSLDGARRIQEFCDREGVQVVFMFGLAAFGLGDNGFDLSFLHPQTVTAERYRRRTADLFAGRAVSAVGWDFGSQAHAVHKYRNLVWLEAEVWGLHGYPSMAAAARPTDLSHLTAEQDAFRKSLSGQRPAAD